MEEEGEGVMINTQHIRVYVLRVTVVVVCVRACVCACVRVCD